MSIELYLQRFESAQEAYSPQPILNRLASVAQSVVAGCPDKTEIGIAAHDGSLSIELPAGTATINQSHGIFPVAQLDMLTVGLIFEIARAGDMVVLAEGGKYPAILTRAEQRAQLPSTLADAPLCTSPSDLASLLDDWYRVQENYHRLPRNHFVDEARRHIPGTRADPLREFLYVQARRHETALAQLNAAGAFLRRSKGSTVGIKPKNGLMGSAGWRLETPAGDRFYAVSVSGDKESWQRLLQEFASSEERSTGRVANFDTLVLSDGRRYPLIECKSERVSA